MDADDSLDDVYGSEMRSPSAPKSWTPASSFLIDLMMLVDGARERGISLPRLERYLRDMADDVRDIGPQR